MFFSKIFSSEVSLQMFSSNILSFSANVFFEDFFFRSFSANVFFKNHNLPHPSFPNTLLHLTSPHDQPHYFISPAANLMTSKQVTSPPGHIAILERLYVRSHKNSCSGTTLVGRLVHILSACFWHSPGSSPCARCVCKFLLWYHSCPSWQDCGHGRVQPKNEKKLEGGWGGGRSASPPDAGSHALFTPMSLHEYASYIDFEVGFGTALVRRLAHVVCASFYFGATQFLLGKTVAMGGCNLKMRRGVGGEGAALPPQSRFTPMSLHPHI